MLGWGKGGKEGFQLPMERDWRKVGGARGLLARDGSGRFVGWVG